MTIAAVAPPGTGVVDVTVSTPGGPSGIAAQDRFAYQFAAPPAVASLSPTFGSSVGGTSVTITGTGFGGASQVSFGTTPAASLNVVSDTQITAVTPSVPSGIVDVTVNGPGGTSPTGSGDQFEFGAQGSNVTPNVGPAGGGTQVVITGVGLSGIQLVSFGDGPNAVFATELKIDSDTQIELTTPAFTPGAAPIHYSDTAGANGVLGVFQFDAPPAVASLSPTFGSSVGGTSVTITGTGFGGASQVSFGTTPAASFIVVSDTQITAVSPAQPSGGVDITVSAAGATSITGPADQFTYTSAGPPQITAMQGGDNPCPGCVIELNTSGGTVVTISGSGFTGATEVRLDTTEWQIDAVSITVLDDNTLQATMPGTPNSDVLNIDVRVITPAGISPITPADHAIFNF